MIKNIYSLLLILLVSSPVYSNNKSRYDLLIECQSKLKEYEWSKYITPKENISSKPKFSDIIDRSIIIDQVNTHLKKEFILKDYFDYKVSPNHVQRELNRIVSNTKDPKSLSEIFNLLNDDPILIGECIVLPNLIERALDKKYFNNEKLHLTTKNKINFDLNKVNSNQKIQNSEKYEIKKYKLGKDGDEQSQTETYYYNENIIPLQKFNILVSKLASQEKVLKQHTYGYSYTEIVFQTESEIHIKQFNWLKEPLKKWIDSFEDYEINNTTLKNIYLPQQKLDHNKEFIIEIDTWNNTSMLSPRAFHSAIWTGNEMIIWGGSDGSVSSHVRGQGLRSGSSFNPATDTWKNISLINSPARRESHTAIWTGTEMIIWGGYSENTLLNAGARYNPITDSWLEINNNESPVPRYNHSSVWTGTEMIVWGGTGSVGSLNTGGKYNPDTDTWTSINIDNSPLARVKHTAIWDGQSMIIWGGIDNEIVYNDGYKYNPASDNWSEIQVEGSPSARYRHSAVWTGDEMIIWGGRDLVFSQFDTGGIYNPSSNLWRPLTDGLPLKYHSAIWTGDRMIVWGTFSDTFDSHNKGLIYNPATDLWTEISESHDLGLRRNHTAIWAGSEMIIWGGSNHDEDSHDIITNFYQDGARYKPQSNSWEVTNFEYYPAKRAGHSSVWTGYEMIFWGSNRTSDFPFFIIPGDRYNPTFDRWTPIIEDSYVERFATKAVWTGTEMITMGELFRPAFGLIMNGIKFNPITGETSQISYNGPGKKSLTFTFTWTGEEVILYGLTEIDDQDHMYGAKYNPESEEWSDINLDNSPSVRTGYTAVWTGEDIIIHGGMFGTQTLSSGSKYNPSNDLWTSIDIQGSPAKRNHSAIWTGQEMVVLGGSGFFNSENAKYDPQADTWANINRIDDEINIRLVNSILADDNIISLGGMTTTNTGYIYDISNDTWTDINSFNSPVRRRNHSLIWTGNTVLIYGGNNQINGTSTRLSSFGVYYPYGLNDVIFGSGFD